MNNILMAKLVVGFALFITWVVLEYLPPKDTQVDVEKLKTYIQMVLMGLAGNMLPQGG